MPDCAANCPPEQEPQHAMSPGLVLDEEDIVRGAFSPMHRTGTGSVKLGAIRNKDLLAGKLSVWRVSPAARTSLDDVYELISDRMPQDNKMLALLKASAGDLRKITDAKSGARALCVVDECETDADGGAHPAHAHIAICRCLRNNISTAEDTVFTGIKELLLAVLRENAIWFEQGS